MVPEDPTEDEVKALLADLAFLCETATYDPITLQVVRYRVRVFWTGGNEWNCSRFAYKV